MEGRWGPAPFLAGRARCAPSMGSAQGLCVIALAFYLPPGPRSVLTGFGGITLTLPPLSRADCRLPRGEPDDALLQLRVLPAEDRGRRHQPVPPHIVLCVGRNRSKHHHVRDVSSRLEGIAEIFIPHARRLAEERSQRGSGAAATKTIAATTTAATAAWNAHTRARSGRCSGCMHRV